MNNLGWGLQMTVLGMGIVFALLAMLWALLVVVLKFDKGDEAEGGDAAAAEGAPAAVEAPEPEVAAADAGAPPRVAQINGMDADLVAAMTVAVLTHKAVRRHEAAPVMRSYWPGSLLYASRWVGSGRARQTNTWQRRG